MATAILSSVFYGFRKHSLSGLQLQTGLQLVQRSICRAADLAVFRRRKAFLLCKNPCGGTAGGRAPAAVWDARPARKIFQRKIISRRVGSAKFVVLPTSRHSKVRKHARLVKSQYRAAPGCQKGRSPSVWERVQRKPFQRVFFGQLLLDGRRRSSLRS